MNIREASAGFSRATEPVLPAAARLASVDMLRGIVMVLMVLDHVRDYFHASAASFDPLDPARTTTILFTTRWVTHFCAPVFVFLAGVSSWLQAARGKSVGGLSRFLLTRGLWLIAMELTVIAFGWSFTFDFLFLQVIWAIGWSMLLLAGLVWLPPNAVLALGILIVAGHNLLDPIQASRFGALAPVWLFLHQPSPITMDSRIIGFEAYPVLPWAGVMMLGYGLGGIFTAPERARRGALLILGAGLLGAFVVLRATSLYGDPRPWAPATDLRSSIMTFLAPSKYPPSLQFVCMTLGTALLVLPFLEKMKGKVAEPWITFGAVPFFFYVLHIYVAHSAALLASLAEGYTDHSVANFFRNSTAIQGHGFSLAIVYLAWIGLVASLYLPCRWFAGVKRRHRGGWTSYL